MLKPISYILAGADMGQAAEVFFARLGLCLLLIILFIATAFMMAVVRANEFVKKELSSHCGNCGYCIKGLSEARCPECGLFFCEAGIDSRRCPRPPYPWTRLIMSFLFIVIAPVVLTPFPFQFVACIYLITSIVAGFVATSLMNSVQKRRLSRWRSESGAMFKRIRDDSD